MKVLIGLVAVHKLQVQSCCSRSLLCFHLLAFKPHLNRVLFTHLMKSAADSMNYLWTQLQCY